MAADEWDDLERLAEGLGAADAATVEAAVARLREHLPVLDDAGFRKAADALGSLFYVDTGERPDLEQAVELAVASLAEQGERAVAAVLVQMEGSDIKAHLHLAAVLGRVGCVALPRLRDLLATAEDPYARAFALFALGKMRCPELADALPEVLGGLMHPDREVRDSAARTVGKIATAVAPGRLTERLRREMFEALLRAARDPQGAVRAKAVRSLGKMGAAGLLAPAQRLAVAELARGALGEGEAHTWDHAFIVRREAREALRIMLEVDPDPSRR